MRLIDADALVGWLKGAGSYLKGLENHKPLTKAIGVIINHIEEIPTIEAVEVVHGRWVVEHEGSVRCSECCFNRASIKIPLDYCPNCGAKMD